MAKTISSLSFDTGNLPPTRSIRNIRIIGTPGATFSLMIRNEDDINQLLPSLPGYDADYYFRPVTGVIKGALKKVVLPDSGIYSFNQIFPTISDDDHYEITIKAEGDTELGASIPRNYDTTGIAKATYKIYQYADAGRATFTLTGDTTGGTAWYLPFPADVVVVKPLRSQIANFKIHWNIRTDDTITVSRQPRFSNDDPDLSDFSGSVDTTRSVFSSVDDSDEITLGNDLNGFGTTNLSVGMIVTGAGIEDKVTIVSIDDIKTLSLSSGITASGYTGSPSIAGFDYSTQLFGEPDGDQLNFSNGGATIDFTTFKVSDPYLIKDTSIETIATDEGENFVDFDAEGTITFGEHNFTYTLSLDDFLTLS